MRLMLLLGGLQRDKRVLYAGPTKEQTDAYWYEVCKILAPLIDNKVLVKNESRDT